MSKSGYVLLAILLAVFSSGCAALSSSVVAYEPGELTEREVGLYNIMEDTVWEGRIRVTGDVYVREGATLTILPGTVVRFDTIEPKLEEDGGRNMLGLDSPYFPGAEIIVRGRIVASGTADRPIVFTSSDRAATAGSWGAINLLGTNDNIIEYCRIYYAYNGIHNHASSAVVLNSVFSNNGTALSFKKADFDNPCKMFIEHNRIVGNKSGISIRNSTANVAFNDITDNEFFGIWVKEGTEPRIMFNEISGNGKGVYLYKASRFVMSYNNIHDNLEYNVAMAELNPNDLDARFNWWGTKKPAEVSVTIYDKFSDPELGRVIFEPILEREVSGIK